MNKLKFKLGQFEFEVEGDKDLINETKEWAKEVISLANEQLNVPAKNEVALLTDNSVSSDEIENVSSIKASKTSNKSLKQSKPGKSQKYNKVELGISNEREFIEEFKKYTGATKVTQKIYVLVYLYKQKTGVEIVNSDIVHSLLNFAQIDTPQSLSQMLINYVNQDKTFNRDGDGFKMRFQTEDKIKEWLVK